MEVYKPRRCANTLPWQRNFKGKRAIDGTEKRNKWKGEWA